MTSDDDLIFEGERVDPDNHHHAGAVRVRLCWRLWPIARRNRDYFIAGHADDRCTAGAFLYPGREPIFQFGPYFAMTRWHELGVRDAIMLSKLHWLPGNGSPELSAVEMLARVLSPYALTIYDDGNAITRLGLLALTP